MKTKPLLTVERVQAELEQTRQKLAAAERALPEAQQRLALSALGGPRCSEGPDVIRQRAATLRDMIAGLEALAPVAERLELLAEIAVIEKACADRRPLIERLRRRLLTLSDEIRVLPPGVADPQPSFLGDGKPVKKHPLVQEYERLRAEQQPLEEAEKLAALRVRAARERVTLIEAQFPHVLDEAHSSAA